MNPSELFKNVEIEALKKCESSLFSNRNSEKDSFYLNPLVLYHTNVL